MKYKVSNVCQLISKSMLPTSQTLKGITVVNNGDGSCTFSGTFTDSTRTSFIINLNYKPINNHIYLALPYTDGDTWKTHLYISWLDSNKNWVADFGYSGGFIKAQPTDKRVYIDISLNFNKGIIYDNFKITPLMFDITEMYGAGNEPTTIEAFRKDFPDEYYEYSPKCFETIHKLHYVNESGKYLTVNRGKFVTETKNLFDLNNAITYTFVNDNVTNSKLYIKDGIYYTAYNNYAIGTGLRIKDGLVLPAGNYSVSAEVVDFVGNINNLVIGVRYKSNGAWKVNVNVPKSFTRGQRIFANIVLPENTETRIYLTFQINDSTTGFASFRNIQVEAGSTTTDYQPYKHIAFN